MDMLVKKIKKFNHLEEIGKYSKSLSIAKKIFNELENKKSSNLKLSTIKNLIEVFWFFDENEYLKKAISRAENILEEIQPGVKYDIEDKIFLLIAKACFQATLMNLDLSLELFNEVLKLNKSQRKKGNIFFNIGIIYLTKGNFAKSFYYFTESIKICDIYGDKIEKSIVLNNLGILKFYMGDFNLSRNIFLESQELREELKKKTLLMIADNNTGDIYRIQRKFNKALIHFQRGLKISKEFQENPDLIYKELKNYCWLLNPWSNEIVTIFSVMKNTTTVFLYNISDIYYSKGNFKKAFKYITQAYEMDKIIGKDTGTADTLYKIIILTILSKELTQTQYYFDLLKKLYEKSAGSFPTIEYYFNFSKAQILLENNDIGDIIKAQKFLEALSKNVNVNVNGPEFYMNIHMFLLKSYILELNLKENTVILLKCEKTIVKIENIALRSNQTQYIVEMQILRYKMLLIKFEISKAHTYLRNLLKKAIKSNFWNLAYTLFEQIKKHDLIKEKIGNLTLKNTTIADRIDLSHIEDYFNYLIEGRKLPIKNTILKKFSTEFIKLALFSIESKEPSVLLSEPLNFTENEKNILQKMAVYNIIALGQGNSRNLGLFGPLPIPETPSHIALIYTFNLYNPNESDKRKNNYNYSYSMAALIMPDLFTKLFSNRREIKERFDLLFGQRIKISDITLPWLKNIKLKLLGLKELF